MTVESDSCFELLLSRCFSGSRCDGSEVRLVIGGWWGSSGFVWGSGGTGLGDFTGFSLTEGGPEVVFISRKE